MRIGLRILLGYVLILGLGAALVFNVFMEELKPGVRQTLEDALIDSAEMFAEMVADDMAAGKLDQSLLVTSMRPYAARAINARIGNVHKQHVDYRVYITDARGIVLFDSENKDLGKDFSSWNDVYLTLRGRYGARSTLANPADENSTVMHVAAPIRKDGKIIGVLTVAKPISSIQPFIARSQQKILRRSAWLLAAVLLIGLGSSLWLSRSLGKLQRYAARVEAGDKVELPDLGKNEIGELGQALEAMRARLEGKQYVEELMHTLAHELKSPIAAIQGAAELMQEDMEASQRRQFLSNIIEQNQRQKQLIDKLLALIKLEKQQGLHQSEQVELAALFEQAAQDCAAALRQRKLRLDCAPTTLVVSGDALLLRQALGNLLDNAIAFSPAGGVITLAAQPEGAWVNVRVGDQGPGIPAFALPRLFDRFYSLARPDADRSTGLGLPFVREVALLHGGKASVDNAEGGGACACLTLPA